MNVNEKSDTRCIDEILLELDVWKEDKRYYEDCNEREKRLNDYFKGDL